VVFVRGVPTPAVLVWFVPELHPGQQICCACREFVDERPERLLGAVIGRLMLAHNGSPEDSGVPVSNA
jgi:hypothetical protein